MIMEGGLFHLRNSAGRGLSICPVTETGTVRHNENSHIIEYIE